MDRRSFLAGACASLVAGCVGSRPEDTGRETPSVTPETSALDGYIRPADDPKTVPEPLNCDTAEFTRYDPQYDAEPRWGDSAQFALRVDRQSADYGDTVRITLRNTADERTVIGIREKYHLELGTQAGWQAVRGYTGDHSVALPDEGIAAEPGTVYEWSLDLTTEGIDDASLDEFVVCPTLRTGRYRFVFWGVDQPLAVAFDLRREQ